MNSKQLDQAVALIIDTPTLLTAEQRSALEHALWVANVEEHCAVGDNFDEEPIERYEDIRGK